jgi:holin-like protein
MHYFRGSFPTGWFEMSGRPSIPARAAPFFNAARKCASIVAQLVALWAVNRVASDAVAWLHAPIPGNVVGFMVLFALLCSGVVKMSWLEPTATFMVKHLAFFFIPITIGLTGMGPLFAIHGAAILVTLTMSAAVGMATSGLTSEYLINAQNASTSRRLSENEV